MFTTQKGASREAASQSETVTKSLFIFKNGYIFRDCSAAWTKEKPDDVSGFLVLGKRIYWLCNICRRSKLHIRSGHRSILLRSILWLSNSFVFNSLYVQQ